MEEIRDVEPLCKSVDLSVELARIGLFSGAALQLEILCIEPMNEHVESSDNFPIQTYIVFVSTP